MEKELNIAPLSAGFMVTSIVGFVISIIMIYPRNSTWGFTLTLFFFLMFVAAMVSLTYAPDNPKY
jgi:formate hydrogenlyase subunit 3/multisubunit Na+/H+ antiporter MnhD subunit|tara:strand:- start:352 stop:546 length:195 start_codon:yes stop_codon:yes gene_type:complete